MINSFYICKKVAKEFCCLIQYMENCLNLL